MKLISDGAVSVLLALCLASFGFECCSLAFGAEPTKSNAPPWPISIQRVLEEMSWTPQRILQKLASDSKTRYSRREIPKEELGINDQSQSVAGAKGTFFNSWAGFIGSRYYTVVAGYMWSDPNVGVVSITEGSKSGVQVFFRTPTPTGPVSIASESGGRLRLISIEGAFDKEDPTGSKSVEQIRTRGHAIYCFDIGSESFTCRP